MNPNMLNRRSMLTGGTLISLSTLLAACVPHDITTAGRIHRIRRSSH